MLERLANSLANFRRDRRAVSVVEFAFVVPVMVMLITVGVDVGRYIYATEQISRVANTMAQIITSKSAIGASGNVTIDDGDLQLVRDSVVVTYPDILAAAKRTNVTWQSLIQVTISSVSFTATPAGCGGLGPACVDTPHVRWTGGDNKRICGTVFVAPLADTDTPVWNGLPGDAYPSTAAPGNFPPTSNGTTTANSQVGDIIVIDISYTFKPFLTPAQASWNDGWMSMPPITIVRSVYVAPRYTSTEIVYSPSAVVPLAQVCP